MLGANVTCLKKIRSACVELHYHVIFLYLGGILGELARTQTPVTPPITIVQPAVQPVVTPTQPSKLVNVVLQLFISCN